MMKRMLIIFAIVTFSTAAAAQVPDSPTGRMAMALAELTRSSGDAGPSSTGLGSTLPIPFHATTECRPC